MHKPRNPTEQLAAAVRGRALYTRDRKSVV